MQLGNQTTKAVKAAAKAIRWRHSRLCRACAKNLAVLIVDFCLACVRQRFNGKQQRERWRQLKELGLAMAGRPCPWMEQTPRSGPDQLKRVRAWRPSEKIRGAAEYRQMTLGCCRVSLRLTIKNHRINQQHSSTRSVTIHVGL